MGKPKRKFTDAVKRTAVDDYVSGRKSAAQIAAALEIGTNMIYRWRVELEEQAKGAQAAELGATHSQDELVAEIQRLKAERNEYQKMVGEQAVIVELLKKRLQSTSLVERSALTGLIETLERAAQKRKRGKL